MVFVDLSNQNISNLSFSLDEYCIKNNIMLEEIIKLDISYNSISSLDCLKNV
jgi:hypothetical protein